MSGAEKSAVICSVMSIAMMPLRPMFQASCNARSYAMRKPSSLGVVATLLSRWVSVIGVSKKASVSL